jgi:heme exporter protein A
VISARGLSKRFGEKRALAAVDIELERGGFLLVTGPNGAGKTTLLRLCAGLLVPSGGEIAIGVDRSGVGLVAHEPLVYRELTPLENLELYGRLYRLQERRERSGMLLERFGLWDVRHERVSSLSRGMTQRLALCRAMLHEPQLLLLDEPYAGLDAEGADLVDRELGGLAGTRTVALATHAPARVEPLASARLALHRAT